MTIEIILMNTYERNEFDQSQLKRRRIQAQGVSIFGGRDLHIVREGKPLLKINPQHRNILYCYVAAQ